ncbi:phospholipase C, phosphocholine-specific [Marinilongibacter aquaticus]|uniref:phosphocholine-specific phospholipase C n=1 Tax=Marinilongibacter aquaticus TaxID=2975157 RepID=UPI0021BDC536|nr:phospholipase C, phosphocholine-specific [Marinilongibacter aquaticus]UBM60865.1 phospholipase C, phosphocholine-specific [Marinilongibacter aquaticus]
MTSTRRDFLKKAALLSGGAGVLNTLPLSIQKALAISPDPQTTFYDAEHVVMLMQENRSFDHCFGTLRGVRGFGDPRAINLPDKKPVWFQPDKEGRRYPPFRLDIHDTKATWMGGVPHSWEDQVDARNEGKFDGWIEAKRPGNKDYKHIPLTMGYYSRQDIPFYYAFADAFTVCDQHFCASLTGTTTNRSYFWTGRTHHDGEKARVRNGELNYSHEGEWATFPERLEDAGISWKVYQNEISLPTLVEDDSLLANFTDNNLEWFSVFGVRYKSSYREFLEERKEALPKEIGILEIKLAQTERREFADEIVKKKKQQEVVEKELERWTKEAFDALSARQKSLHSKAFATNEGDPDYHKVELMSYMDGTESRETKVPKGDILHRFRKDVNEGTLPTVSWLVAPQKFSDHPSAPWYGAWYISEVLDILTKNPEVWKKTIFILNYDENDGYFDHVPPFVAPNPKDTESGLMSNGLSAAGEFVTKEEEVNAGFKEEQSRTSPVGLGFRVPLVVASPWSRGGWVNSEIFDITSTIQFLEKFLSKKTGKQVVESNISSWRRNVSGDLTSVFRPYNGEKIELPKSLDRNEFVQGIYNASFKAIPNNWKTLSADEIDSSFEAVPKQEAGTRPSCALKYELNVDGQLSADGSQFEMAFEASNDFFGEEALGAAFNVYAVGNYRKAGSTNFESVGSWAFAVKAGDTLKYTWPLANFENGNYHLRVYGPNGYFREFVGSHTDGLLTQCTVAKGKLGVKVKNTGASLKKVDFSESNYRKTENVLSLEPKAESNFVVETASNQGWYDFKLSTENGFLAHYAGRVETGKPSISDPAIGK